LRAGRWFGVAGASCPGRAARNTIRLCFPPDFHPLRRQHDVPAVRGKMPRLHRAAVRRHRAGRRSIPDDTEPLARPAIWYRPGLGVAGAFCPGPAARNPFRLCFPADFHPLRRVQPFQTNPVTHQGKMASWRGTSVGATVIQANTRALICATDAWKPGDRCPVAASRYFSNGSSGPLSLRECAAAFGRGHTTRSIQNRLRNDLRGAGAGQSVAHADAG